MPVRVGNVTMASNAEVIRALNADMRRLGIPTNAEVTRAFASDLERLGFGRRGKDRHAAGRN